MVRLHFTKLNDKAVTPRRGSAEAAGLDLAACADVRIPARSKCLVETGLAVAIPKGHYGRIAPRSGFSWRNHVDVGAGDGAIHEKKLSCENFKKSNQKKMDEKSALTRKFSK